MLWITCCSDDIGEAFLNIRTGTTILDLQDHLHIIALSIDNTWHETSAALHVDVYLLTDSQCNHIFGRVCHVRDKRVVLDSYQKTLQNTNGNIQNEMGEFQVLRTVSYPSNSVSLSIACPVVPLWSVEFETPHSIYRVRDKQ